MAPSESSEAGKRGAARRVRSSTPADAPAIAALMRTTGLDPHADPAHLDWKYWRERADWGGSRSYVVTDGSEILAHGGVAPGICRWGTKRLRIIHMIDWAAYRDGVGAGVTLMKHIGNLADFLLGIGGSADTLKLLPLTGYEHCGVATGYVRSLSPLALIAGSSDSRWRLAGRFARSALWSTTAPRVDVGRWRARRIGVEEIGRVAALPRERPGVAVFERSEMLFRYLLACPIIPMELYALENEGAIRGYFLMSYAPGQARLADCWMESEDPADWRALIELAVRQAKARKGLAEIVSWSSERLMAQSLEGCGFHKRFTIPIYLRSSHGIEVPKETLRVQMLENDAFYLQSGQSELWA